MQVYQTSSFRKKMKKLHPNEKKYLDKAVKEIIENPYIGESKVGDLNGGRVYKFYLVKQICLLAYSFEGENMTLLALGSHENFYREVKRSF